jgi:hypothetical protein
MKIAHVTYADFTAAHTGRNPVTERAREDSNL